jgi:hypothetical protein
MAYHPYPYLLARRKVGNTTVTEQLSADFLPDRVAVEIRVHDHAEQDLQPPAAARATRLRVVRILAVPRTEHHTRRLIRTVASIRIRGLEKPFQAIEACGNAHGAGPPPLNDLPVFAGKGTGGLGCFPLPSYHIWGRFKVAWGRADDAPQKEKRKGARQLPHGGFEGVDAAGLI